MKLTVNRNLQIGFGLSLLLLIISSTASYISIQNLLSSSKLVKHTNQVMLELEDVISTVKDAETGQRGYLLTNDKNFLSPYIGAAEKSQKIINRLKILSKEDPVQQQNTLLLEKLIKTKLAYLDTVINERNAGKVVSAASFLRGKKQMDDARELVNTMHATQSQTLSERTDTVNQFAEFTPLLILFAALLSFIITIFSYFKVNRDFTVKNKLQEDLLETNRVITGRINTIKSLTKDIAEGNYEIRINEPANDELGRLASLLDKMAASLQSAFFKLTENEWLQTGIAKLNETIVGEKDIQSLTSQIIEFIAEYTESQAAVIYLKENNDLLKFQSGFAFSPSKQKQYIQLGEGLAGQSAMSGRQMIIKDISADDLSINFATGSLKPKNILALPIFNAHRLEGVIELASVNEFTENIQNFLRLGGQNIGIAIATAQIRKRQQELLEETQAQSEELQVQHSELENLNTELEIHTQKIQASEEELKVQQEELIQNNRELEERSSLLEEKNQVIVERNLEIQQKGEQLQLSTKYKSEFLANMSHELRTPLNSILLLSRLMSENQSLDKEHIEYAEVIQSAGQGLLSLIDEILDLSKIEAGKMNLDYVSLTIEEIVKDMRSLFEPMMKEKELEFKINIQASAPKLILTDKMRLEQILKNLLSNALKFTSKGFIQLKISQPDNAPFIHFSVKDTGIGISEKKQQLVFEAFQQEDGSTKRRFGGTGLGLSISRELAKLLGGEIKLISTPGEGSEFRIILPVSRPKSTDLSELNFKTQPEIQVTQAHENHNGHPHNGDYVVSLIPEEIADDRNALKTGDKLILIIEDDTLFAKALLDYTRKKGFKGIVLVQGDQGLPFALKYQPLAILLDIQLPVKDGWQVMEELKSNPKTRHIPVHIMSSMEMKKESLLKGAIDFINKPVALEQMNQIFNKIQQVLSREPKKVLIVEENPKHAKALGFFLSSFNINSEISGTVTDGINLLNKKEIDCVILDMGVPDQNGYETLDMVKKSPGMENLPIIIFTGKNLSRAEESRIKKYADSIVVKTAHSYQRILDEVELFLHVVEDSKQNKTLLKQNGLGALQDVLKNKTVLIADDDVRNIFFLTKALEKHGMNIVSAIDGKDALKQLTENASVDIVLMDMMMPEMDGYESTARIRKNPKFKNLPVLAVTAKAMMGDREKCIIAGASDYISKPVDIDQLISLLRVWLYDSHK